MLPEDTGEATQIDFVKVYHGSIALTETSLSETDICLESGISKQISAEVLSGVATNKDIVWQSADENIAILVENEAINIIKTIEVTTTV